MSHSVALIPGDGIGPEVSAEARRVVDALGLALQWTELPWGSAFFHEQGRMMPEDALEQLREFDAVLLGAFGDPSVPDHVSLWGSILAIRQGLDLWANLRPARLLEGVPCPLAGRGPADIDLLFVRENTEGEYAGVGGIAHRGLDSEVGIETSVFTRGGCERVIRHAFELAAQRRGVVTSATKSNASRFGYVLWDEVAERVAAEHPDVRYERVLVDALAARIVRVALLAGRRRRVEPLRRHPHRPRRGDSGRDGHGGVGQRGAGIRRAGRVRAGARVGAGHRRTGDRESLRSDLERLAPARASG